MEHAVVWYDGKFVPAHRAVVPFMSHALHYGSAVFEGIRAYETVTGPAVFRLRDHVARLYRSAAVLRMKIPYTQNEIAAAITDVVRRNHLGECYIRPLVFYGEGQMALFPKGAALHVGIAAWPWPAYLDAGRPLNIGTSPFRRFHPATVAPDTKVSGYYATAVMATLDARKRGLDECLLLDTDGYVAEGPGENIFIVKRGALIVPQSPAILHGITRDSIITMARHLHIPVVDKKVTLTALMSADEVFMTGTATEVAAIGRIDGRRIGKGAAGPITRQLKEVYRAAIHGEVSRYRAWLTPITQRSSRM